MKQYLSAEAFKLMNKSYQLFVDPSREDTPEPIDGDQLVDWVAQQVDRATLMVLGGRQSLPSQFPTGPAPPSPLFHGRVIVLLH